MPADTERAIDHLPPLPESRDLTIGCVGAGFIMADCHLVAYRQAGFPVAGICSRRRSTAEKVAKRHQLPRVYANCEELASDPTIDLVDVAVPPDVQWDVIRTLVEHGSHLKGILAQKPLGVNYAQAAQIVDLCRNAGIPLAVNQNMRFDHSVRAARSLLQADVLGTPVLGTIEMRAIPHWMPWQQRQGWVTLRIMSIHHLDTLRYWFGNPARVFASVRPDPRTAQQFEHQDGICLTILEYDDGLRASCWDDVWGGPIADVDASDLGIRWRIEGTRGLARGTIGWPRYPERSPSTIDYTTADQPRVWQQPRWEEAWFPDAFVGPMADLMIAVKNGSAPTLSGEDNLKTMAVVDACYLSAAEHRAVAIEEIEQQPAT